ncbi:ABC transporter permease [Paracoccus aminophilus]|uniref:Nopaline transport system, permease protein NocQ n=1 Tax=Paracoccus aminophilus JCM 7686 TaxID=1367847 RepID=S5XV22_PARAH|nr:ABC transporter permease subunit [Paracoccus aminophilus]AGT09057.1 nopaline transport system, permease protein NocQ [Paracoccus aminophilus JCM 7686]
MQFGLLQLWEGGWIGALLRGATITVLVGLCAMGAGLMIGIICGLIKWGRVKPLNWLVDIYTTVVRGVPELLVIYLLFFSSVEFVTRVATAFGWAGLADTGYAFIIAVIAIAAISGSYSTEVVRGALSSIPKGHLEAARALGMPGRRIFRKIILPQMLRIAVPGMNNVWQATMKDTALVSVVGLQELMRAAFVGAGSTRNPFIFYLIAAIIYLIITFVSQVFFKRAERALVLKGRG